ncbi:metal-dependent hydrolase [Fervidicoccus fontis]|uniref:UPF0173 metal-dependent hydrolase IOK49_01030 n=2 Tax=Fervidicoccus fontis TaxID=683846 RepID=A0A843AGN7_9CREN|nr:metal-dependent hydrolase [Fervidicoccus fontis]MBE9390670.1 metal-dependent hydrolase [Fervidicoccus fontis]
MTEINYYGHSAFEIQLVGLDNRVKTVLIDPWITNPLSKAKVEDFSNKKIDYIIVTHDHSDHLGNAYDICKITGAKMVGVYELAEEAEKNGISAIGGNIGGRLSIDDLDIVLVPAVHSSEKAVPVGVVVSGRDFTFYHAGDTGVFTDMSIISELYSPDLAFLPIGGHFTMGIKEAVKAVQLIKPKMVVPMHYNTFEEIKADPLAFKSLVESLTKTKVIVVNPGEKIIL